MPSTTISPCLAARKAGPRSLAYSRDFAIIWSAGKTPMTASGSIDCRICAARPMAGAVLRAAGSAKICFLGTSGSWSTISPRRWSLVRIQIRSGGSTGRSRSTVCWIRERSPKKRSTCLARFRRLRGQKRVPRPPARIKPCRWGILLAWRSAHQFERTFPARLHEEILRQVSVMIAGVADPMFGGRIIGPKNHQRLADNVLARHETPVAAVERVVAIVAHRKVVARRHHQLTASHVSSQHFARAVIDRTIRLRRKIIAIRLDAGENMARVGFIELLAVAVYRLVDDFYMIARDADHPLDVILPDIHRVAKHDDVAPLRLRIRQQMFADDARGSIGKLVDQQMIAHHHGCIHGRRGHDESLHQRGGAEQQDQDIEGPLVNEIPR